MYNEEAEAEIYIEAVCCINLPISRDVWEENTHEPIFVHITLNYLSCTSQATYLSSVLNERKSINAYGIEKGIWWDILGRTEYLSHPNAYAFNLERPNMPFF